MQQLAGLITESQIEKLLLESTNQIPGKDGITILVSDWVKNHIMDHNKPGVGSVFKKGITDDQILKMVEKVSNQVSGKGGPYQLDSPGIGYDLVLPIDDAKKLKDAKEGTVVKQEGPNKIKVPSISTSQPITDFSTNKVSLLIFPSNPQYLPDDLKNDENILNQIKQGKNYSLVTSFPGNPNIPKASEWNGKYAVILPGQSDSTNENKLLKEDSEFFHRGRDGSQTIIVPDDLGDIDSDDFYDQLEALGDGRMSEIDFEINKEYEMCCDDGGDEYIFKFIKKGNDLIIDKNSIKIEENKKNNFDLRKYLAENKLLKENIDDAKFEQLIDDKIDDFEDNNDSFIDTMEIDPLDAFKLVGEDVEEDLNKLPNKGEYEKYSIEVTAYHGGKKISFNLIGHYSDGDTEQVTEYDYEI